MVSNSPKAYTAFSFYTPIGTTSHEKLSDLTGMSISGTSRKSVNLTVPSCRFLKVATHPPVAGQHGQLCDSEVEPPDGDRYLGQVGLLCSIESTGFVRPVWPTFDHLIWLTPWVSKVLWMTAGPVGMWKAERCLRSFSKPESESALCAYFLSGVISIRSPNFFLFRCFFLLPPWRFSTGILCSRPSSTTWSPATTNQRWLN